MTNDMQPPLRQPIGFWTARAGEAIRSRTRSRLAEAGITQPEWWVLHQLSLHRDGVAEHDVVATVGPNESDTAITTAIDAAIDKRWIVRDAGVLTLTAAGAERFTAGAGVQGELEAERRQGISDDDFATTITVLQRTIRNVGGQAWHW